MTDESKQRLSFIDVENELNEIFKDFTNVRDYNDLNGLQIGTSEWDRTNWITGIVTGVSLEEELIDKAMAVGASVIIVHHGMFWKGESPGITGSKLEKIKKCVQGGIEVYAYHLPLDMHETYGNNNQLLWHLWHALRSNESFNVTTPEKNVPFSYMDFELPTTPLQMAQAFEMTFDKEVREFIGNPDRSIKRIGVCTGGGQQYYQKAIDNGCDAFISGEISLPQALLSKEHDVPYFVIGHHTSETLGVQAIGKHFSDKFDVNHEFINIDHDI